MRSSRDPNRQPSIANGRSARGEPPIAGQEAAKLRGEAITLWRLEREHEHLHCFLVEPPRGFWLAVQRGSELVFSETYAELEPALLRADGLKSPLVVAGWAIVDEDRRPGQGTGAA